MKLKNFEIFRFYGYLYININTKIKTIQCYNNRNISVIFLDKNIFLNK